MVSFSAESEQNMLEEDVLYASLGALAKRGGNAKDILLSTCIATVLGGGLRKARREMSRAIFQNVADKAATISTDAATEKNHSRAY